MSKKSKKDKKSKIKVAVITIISIILIAIIAGVVIVYLEFIRKYESIQIVEINEEELGINEEVEENLEGYRNIVIYGVDSNYGLEEGTRSDSIILVTLNEATNEVDLTSIYRDTYVEIPGYGLDKINHAYSYGSAELALKTLNTNFDLSVTEFVTVNFETIKDVVDYIGGVEITITSEEVSHINGISKAGTYNLTGEQVLAYSRIRYATGGDYVRTERMRTVLEAVTNKIKSFSFSELNELMDFVLPKIYTNLTISDITEMIPRLPSIQIKDSIGWPYYTRGITLDAWYGVPVTLEGNVTRLHNEIFDNQEYVPSSQVIEINDKIVSRTGYTEDLIPVGEN